MAAPALRSSIPSDPERYWEIATIVAIAAGGSLTYWLWGLPSKRRWGQFRVSDLVKALFLTGVLLGLRQQYIQERGGLAAPTAWKSKVDPMLRDVTNLRPKASYEDYDKPFELFLRRMNSLHLEIFEIKVGPDNQRPREPALQRILIQGDLYSSDGIASRDREWTEEELITLYEKIERADRYSRIAGDDFAQWPRMHRLRFLAAAHRFYLEARADKILWNDPQRVYQAYVNEVMPLSPYMNAEDKQRLQQRTGEFFREIDRLEPAWTRIRLKYWALALFAGATSLHLASRVVLFIGRLVRRFSTKKKIR